MRRYDMVLAQILEAMTSPVLLSNVPPLLRIVHVLLSPSVA